jgi:VanZ family protein
VAPTKPSLSAAAVLGYVALVAYASLFPFGPWRWPPDLTGSQLLPPWPRWVDPVDTWVNAAGYLPLGVLIAWALLRRGWRAGYAVLVAVVAASALSLSMEVLQQFLRPRVPSARDWALNTAGAAIGALLGWGVHRLGWLARWRQGRDAWFPDGSAGAQALLLSWPLALLAPSAVPLGLGNAVAELEPLVVEALRGTPWALPDEPLPLQSLSPLSEALTVMLGLLAPVLLAYAVSPPGWRRLGLLAGAVAAAVGMLALSTGLNFGPLHALTWWRPTVAVGLVFGALTAAALAWVGRRVCTLLALMVLVAAVVLVAQTPGDAYFVERLQAWEQGRFVRFHGLAQWIAWGWPYFAMLWLLAHRPPAKGR